MCTGSSTALHNSDLTLNTATPRKACLDFIASSIERETANNRLKNVQKFYICL
jgi:hypothetical protein